MGYQFAHIETYSRAGRRSGGHTVCDIISESCRSPESCLHVSSPKPPVHVYGCDFEELQRQHDDLIQSAKETLANGKTRSVRKDTSSLFTCVLSHPATPQECRDNPATKAAVEGWVKDSTKWLHKEINRHGGSLVTVIMHTDESHMHIHAYGLHHSGHADCLHPGKTAKKSAVASALADGQDKKTANAIGDRAYTAAMRAWQDSYSMEVGLPHGLTRLGPARRRLTRAEWHTEKASAESVRKARELEKEANRSTDAARRTEVQILEKAQQNARLLALEGQRRIDSAKRLEATASRSATQAHAVLQDANRQRDRILVSARIELNRIRAFASRIRTFWDALHVSSLREKIRQEMKVLLDREADRAEQALRNARDEMRKRLSVEKQLSETIQSVRSVTYELDKMRRERDRLLGTGVTVNGTTRLKLQ